MSILSRCARAGAAVAIAAALGAAAERIENITKKLNQTVSNGDVTLR